MFETVFTMKFVVFISKHYLQKQKTSKIVHIYILIKSRLAQMVDLSDPRLSTVTHGVDNRDQTIFFHSECF